MYEQRFYGWGPVVELVTPRGPQQVTLRVQLCGDDGDPDCVVGHFGYNFWVRTRAGLKRRRYISEARMRRAVEQALQRYQQLTVQEWRKR